MNLMDSPPNQSPENDPQPIFEAFPRSRPPWRVEHAILYFVVAAIVSVVLGALLINVVGFYGSVLIAEIVGFGLIPLALTRRFATELPRQLQHPQVPRSFWMWTVIAVVAFATLHSNLPVLIDRFYPIPKEQFELFRRYLAADTPAQFLFFVLVAAVVPAICEELAFRGLIQSGLRRSLGPKIAVIAAGFLFALLHLNPWNFIGLWVFGCFLGYLVERSGTLYPSILGHMLNNSMALLVFSLQSAEEWDEPLEFIPWYWTLVAGLVLVGAVIKLHQSSGLQPEQVSPEPIIAPEPPR
jgi:membrane protease YdiL (CAAX protease family)